MKLRKLLWLVLVFSKRLSSAEPNASAPLIDSIQIVPVLESHHPGNAVQLNVSWETTLPPKSLFDVYVTLLSDQGMKFYCKPSACAKLNVNSTNILLPQYMIDNDFGECAIYLGCDYKITIQTINQDVSVDVQYNVDECVNNFCSCHFENFLPTSQFSVAVDPKNNSVIDISYTVRNVSNAPRNSRLVKVIFSIETVRAFRGWMDTTDVVLRIPDRLLFNKLGVASNKVHLILDEELEAGKNYSFKSFIIDSRNCQGPAVEKIVQIPRKSLQLNSEPSESHTLIILLLAFLCSIALVSSSVVLALFFIRHRKQHNNIHKWRGVFNTTDTSSTAVHSIPMHENALYYLDHSTADMRSKVEADALEVPHSALRLGPEIGKGAFGRVFYGTAVGIPGKPSPCVVAVKQLKRRATTDELEEFTGEITTMKKVGRHPNIVSLLGFCTKKQPLLMIMEYVGCGDLLKYLHKVREKRELAVNKDFVELPRKSRSQHKLFRSSESVGSFHKASVKNYADLAHQSSSDSTTYISQPDPLPSIVITQPSSDTSSSLNENASLISSQRTRGIEYVLDHNELQTFAIQIARGMKHLEKKQITHRDLAARNILIDESKTLKISDFGLSRMGIYVNTKTKQVPLRWLSIESIRDSLYSSKSDVWAFGVVLWEIGTLGAFPYTTVPNMELLSYLQAGKRLERPENVSLELYELMLECWSELPRERPSFEEILGRLEPQKQQIYIDFNEINPNYIFPPTRDQVAPLGARKDRTTIAATNEE